MPVTLFGQRPGDPAELVRPTGLEQGLERGPTNDQGMGRRRVALDRHAGLVTVEGAHGFEHDGAQSVGQRSVQQAHQDRVTGLEPFLGDDRTHIGTNDDRRASQEALEALGCLLPRCHGCQCRPAQLAVFVL